MEKKNRVKNRQATTHCGGEKKCFISRLEEVKKKHEYTTDYNRSYDYAHIHSPVRTLFPTHEIPDLACNRLHITQYFNAYRHTHTEVRPFNFL